VAFIRAFVACLKASSCSQTIPTETFSLRRGTSPVSNARVNGHRL